MERVISPNYRSNSLRVVNADIDVASRNSRVSARNPLLCSRSGIASFELLVTGALLLVLMSIVAQVSTSCSRLWQETRSYRLASTELATQMERLTLLSEEELKSQLENWQPSAELLEILPAVELRGEVVSADDGQRLKLSLNWRRKHDGPPLVLIGWLLNQQPPKSDEG